MRRISIALRENQIGLTELNGELEQPIRVNNLNKFRQDPQCQVLLATIRSSGVGIDLRCAQRVYIMVRLNLFESKDLDCDRTD